MSTAAGLKMWLTGSKTFELENDMNETTSAGPDREPDPMETRDQPAPVAAPATHNRPGVFKAWWQASRPPFYIATLVPLTLGFTAAVKFTGQCRWGLYLLILFASFVVHMATNLANDLFDHVQGVDAGPNIGGSRVLQEGKISARALTTALILLYSLGLITAVIIVHLAARPVLWLLIVFAALSSFFYVAPPIKYGHRALGELFVFINMGLIMTAGTFLAAAGIWDNRVLALAVPVGFMVAGILYYQSLPEIDTDLAAGKRTVANVLGRDRAALAFIVWWPLIWLLMINLWLAGLAAWTVVFCLLTCPLHLAAIKKIKAAGDGDWLPLDRHGHLVRKLYFANGLILIASVAWL